MNLEPFLSWFHSNGGSFDASSLEFFDFPPSEGGRGVIARRDISEGHILFTIPRSLTLSTRTSSLPLLFGAEQWKAMKLDQDWTGLILCMMWEAAVGTSKWSAYFDILPAQFDTPMFWNEDDLAELEGTSLVEKLGRAQAELSYKEKVVPAIQSRSDLFPPEKVPLHYSLPVYHLMGSRILSRSFSVEKWDAEEGQELHVPHHPENHQDGMDVDSNVAEGIGESGEEPQHVETEEDDDGDESSDIAMVPMADMLNARYGSENAKLFYEEHELRMVATKPIKPGEQIWNTYGDPPNQELLRRYGHVDWFPLPHGGEGNPGDVVEIRADIIVSVVRQRNPLLTSESSQGRIDWWLEEGGDDVFVIESDLEIPLVLIAFVRLLIIEAGEWEKARDKGKPPKPKVDENILSILQDVFRERLKLYPTDLEHDESLLPESIPINKRNAIIVRIGEKRILQGMMVRVNELRKKETGHNKRKSGGEDRSSVRVKKARK